jgi:hypothetical protein
MQANVAAIDTARLNLNLRERLTGWQGLLQRPGPRGGAAPSPLARRTAHLWCYRRYGGPNGIRMVVGHELTFELKGTAVRP